MLPSHGFSFHFCCYIFVNAACYTGCIVCVSGDLQETEKMLAVGVPVLGIGKLVMKQRDGDAAQITLNAPDEGRRYIITTSSRSELLRTLRSDARIIRVVLWVLGLSGAGYLAYVVYRYWKRTRSARRTRRLLDDYRRQRRSEAASTEHRQTDEVAEQQMTCTICLSNPRDVILLDCGHICACGECALRLPEPRRCPICAQSISRILPTYIS